MNSYFNYLFETPSNTLRDKNFQSLLLEKLKKESLTHIPIDFIDFETLDKWYHSEGRYLLKEVFIKIWNILSNLSNMAMPSHDARHAIFKVPASALELINSENVIGWERVGVLGALMHDWGRWSEERIFGAPQGGSTHSRMSFVLAREFLAPYSIPDEIKWHILNAVLVHTKGATELEPMPTKLTVTADREQLWGPEFILRLMHHIEKPGTCETMYPEEGKSDILSKIERIFTHRLLGPLHTRNEHLKVLKSTTAQFLYLSGTDKYRDNIFELMEASQSWLPIDYKNVLSEADNFETNITHPGIALNLLLDAKNIAPNQYYIDKAIERVSKAPHYCHQRLAKAIMLADSKKKIEDKRIKSSLQKLLVSYRDDDFLLEVTKNLLQDI